MPRTASPTIRPKARSERRSERRRKPVPVATKRAPSVPTPGAAKARRKFLKVFPNGFRDDTYWEWERAYKWGAHQRWERDLSKSLFHQMLLQGDHERIARSALSIESRTNLLFSFEKMALRDAVGSITGAKAFATGLFEFLHGTESLDIRFEAWIDVIGHLPRRKTRVLTWPAVTVFGFIAQPRTHFFFKPTVTREAARRYGKELEYGSRPSWQLYRGLLQFVNSVRHDIRNLRPRDMIDLQSYLWVQGSEEYPD